MKRVKFVWLFLFPVLAWGAADSYRLSWRSDPATSMVIAWNQCSGMNPVVCYDTADHEETAKAYRFRQAPDRVVDYRGMNNHFVRLENLTPDTAYYFVVSDSEGVGQRMWFRTTPKTEKPFTFIAGGDSRSDPVARREGNKLVAKLRPLFVLFGGDYTGSGTADQWRSWMKDWQLTISDDGRLYPIIATHGNHENADMQMMDKLFDTPNTNQFYSFGVAGDLLRIWALNSELEDFAPEIFREQTAWLEKDLPRYPDVQWKLATYHRPMRPHTSRKGEGQKRITQWAPLFYDNGVDLIVESDTHMVKRSYPVRPDDGEGSFESFIRDDAKGMVFIGEGSWGAPTRPVNDEKPWTMASASFHQFKWIQVSSDEMLIRTVKFEAVDQVESLTEKTLFNEPKNMVFWEPDTGKILRLPFDATHKSHPKAPQWVSLVERGAAWEWSLDAKTWSQGVAPLGYGDSLIKTAIVEAGEKPPVAFFRKVFTLRNNDRVASLYLDVQADDGCVVLLNGKEVVRHNMPEGEITNQTWASKGVGGFNEKYRVPKLVDPKYLVSGKNRIEVRVHQESASSSDLIFDLSVRVKKTL